MGTRCPSRVMAVTVVVFGLSACTSGGSSPDGTTTPPRTTTTGVVVTDPSTTTLPPTTAESTSTTMALENSYAVVAWERGRTLVILEPIEEGTPCPPPPEPIFAPCGSLIEVGRVSVPYPPHNLAAHGSVVVATHPAAATVTRLDVSTGEVATVSVGSEPHDADFSLDGKELYVSDEDGRRLIVLDAGTLEEIAAIALPGRAHDAALGEDGIWVTLIGRDELALVGWPGLPADGTSVVELVPTGGSPHDLVLDPAGKVWFSNWGSSALNVYDPVTGVTSNAPSGVEEPHHFALDGEGQVWVSDNGGDSVVRFSREGPTATVVGATPHHLGFLNGMMVVAVSGSGETVAVSSGQVIARVPVGAGLHGVAVVTTGRLVLAP